MAYGFMATNGNSQILVSDTCKNFHYMGKINVYNVSNINVIADGVEQSASGTLGYGKRIHYYRFSMPDTVTIPLLFFTMPSTSSYYAISKQYSVGVDWEIEIISYANAVSPEVYVFSELTSRSKAFSSWGIKINSSSQLGGPAFDSRFTPLVIQTTIPVLAPTNVIVFPNTQPQRQDSGGPTWLGAPSWTWVRGFYSSKNNSIGLANAWNNGEFNSLLQNTTYNTYVNSVGTKPMYHYSSFQVANKVSELLTGNSRQDLGFWQPYMYIQCTGVYWAIFRNAIRQGSGFLAAGWIPEVVGYRYTGTETESGGWWFNNSPTAGGAGLNSISTPNFNESVTNPVIIADAGFYDYQSTSGYTFFN